MKAGCRGNGNRHRLEGGRAASGLHGEPTDLSPRRTIRANGENAAAVVTRNRGADGDDARQRHVIEADGATCIEVPNKWGRASNLCTRLGGEVNGPDRTAGLI